MSQFTLRKTFNVKSRLYYFFCNGVRCTQAYYDQMNDYGNQNMRSLSFRVFRHGTQYLEDAPLLSTESVYCEF